MQRLWAPWRMPYLQGETETNPCFLCEAGAGRGGAGLVVWRGRLVFAMLNGYPYANGHVMIAPYVHEGDLTRLESDAARELVDAARIVIAALRTTYGPEGFNVGANLGAAAGAGLAAHLHLHVVPRWIGDTNFMTTTGETRVIPEDLGATAARLRAALSHDQEEE